MRNTLHTRQRNMGLKKQVMNLQNHLLFGILFGLLLLLVNNSQSQCAFTASTSGFNASYTQVYVLTNAATGEILAQNQTGDFQSPGSGVFHIHALNYNPLDAPDPLPSDLVAQSIELVGSVSLGCYNADFLSDFVTEACSSCEQTLTLCDADPLMISSSGSTSGYTQLYVLVDAANGTIVATSASGNFTGQIIEGSSYEAYALNYSPSEPPNPLPIVGDQVNNVGSQFSGCYNADYLDDYICINVTDCAESCAQSSTIELGTNLQSSTSGENQVYQQVFVLTDTNGNFIDQNTSGLFDSNMLGVGNYQIHAINYNTFDPPSPLPSDLNTGDDISLITGGCFNNDFLDDYICFEVVLILMPIELLSFDAKLINSNMVELKWSTQSERNNDFFTIEKSTNGLEWSRVGTTQGAGTSQVTLNYFMPDNAPYSGVSYYRLKQTDYNGQFSYSDIKAIDNQVDLSIYPNPCRNELFISFGNLTPENIGLFNAQGEEVLGFSAYGIDEQLKLNLSPLSKGIYLLKIKHKQGMFTRKIILQ